MRKNQKAPLHKRVCKICKKDFKGSHNAKYCKNCHKQQKVYKLKTLDYRWRLGKLFQTIKNRIASKKIPLNIDLNYLCNLWEKNDGCCALTGFKFDLNNFGKRGNIPREKSVSIDRIIPSKGYTKGNVRLITFHMNIALGSFGDKKFNELAIAFQNNGVTI